MLALDETTKSLSVDASRVSIWGASMGGQGATTIGWHHPDRFASVTSFFGDARFDTATYVKNILPTEEAAHAINPLDVAENARHQKVLLVHGEDDHTSLIHESELLDQGLRKLGYDVTFVRHPHMGHEAPMIMLHVKDFVKLAAETTSPRAPTRVTFRSVRAEDTSAYGVTIERAHAGDAFIDVERGADGTVRVVASTNVKAVSIGEGALGGAHAERRMLK
jgi:predicted peptidase